MISIAAVGLAGGPAGAADPSEAWQAVGGPAALDWDIIGRASAILAPAAMASPTSWANGACAGKPEPPIDCSPSTGDLRVTPQEMADIACARWKPGSNPADVNNQVIQDIVALVKARNGTGTVRCGYDTRLSTPTATPRPAAPSPPTPAPPPPPPPASGPPPPAGAATATPTPAVAGECFQGGVAKLTPDQIRRIIAELRSAGLSEAVIRAEVEARNETAGGQGQFTCDLELRPTGPASLLPPSWPPASDQPATGFTPAGDTPLEEASPQLPTDQGPPAGEEGPPPPGPAPTGACAIFLEAWQGYADLARQNGKAEVLRMAEDKINAIQQRIQAGQECERSLGPPMG